MLKDIAPSRKEKGDYNLVRGEKVKKGLGNYRKEDRPAFIPLPLSAHMSSFTPLNGDIFEGANGGRRKRSQWPEQGGGSEKH